MRADHETGRTHLAQLVPAHQRNERIAATHVVREALLGADEPRRDEERGWNLVLDQDRSGILIIVQVAVIEGDTHERLAGAGHRGAVEDFLDR